MPPFPPVQPIDPRRARDLFHELPSSRALARAKSLIHRTYAATIVTVVLFCAGLLNMVWPFIDALAGFLTTTIVCGLVLLQSRRATAEIDQIKEWLLSEPKVSPASLDWLRELHAVQTSEVARTLLGTLKIERDVAFLSSILLRHAR